MHSRAQTSQQVRECAAELAKARGAVVHVANGEKYRYRSAGKNKLGPSHVANFTKGLPHYLETGLLANSVDYQLFIRGIDSGDPLDFEKTPLGPKRKDGGNLVEPSQGCPSVTAIQCSEPPRENPWESQLAKTGNLNGPVGVRAWEASAVGTTFDLEGPDALSVTMPPAPRLDSFELAGELVEVYAQALLRDHHVSQFRNDVNGNVPIDSHNDYDHKRPTTGISTDQALALINIQDWFGLSPATPGPTFALHSERFEIILSWPSTGPECITSPTTSSLSAWERKSHSEFLRNKN